MGIKVSELNNFSFEYANRLFSKLPIFKEFTKIENDGSGNYIFVKYPCSDQENHLYVVTYNDEIIV